MKRWLEALISLLFLAVLLWALSVPHGMVPPLGKLLDPCTGFWRNNAASDKIPKKLAIPGLKERVTVVWDDRHVPHIFAGSEADLYRAQGYMTARDRLWQMDFLSRYTGGRLSEIIGPRTVEMDLVQRRLGMVWGAENFLKGIEGDAAMRGVLSAYCGGVNAYVDSLTPSDYPLEYKVLGYAPGRWTAMDIALLLKYLAWYLSGEGKDLGMTRTRAALGEGETDSLFPYSAPFQDPVIPKGTQWDFIPVLLPRAEPGNERVGEEIQGMARPVLDLLTMPVGSNNWAVSGKKTESGFPILCGDPHLQLTLPSIWYEVQLSAPGINVRGVSLPGAPGVVIGFNETTAWSMTNAGSDVLDFYALEFRNAARREYAWGGGWRRASVRRELIEVRSGQPVVENVLYTHLGPVPYPEQRPGMPDWLPAGCAMRWTGHDASGILNALYLLNRARDLDAYHAAMARFDCPALNVAFASQSGHIAIRHNGKFPLRARGQGRYMLDGSSPDDEWREWVPMDQVPRLEDPERGFVSSANQPPADESYPYYLGWDYENFQRGRRINELLEAAFGITPQDMARMLGDSLSLRARAVLPRLLQILQAADLSAAERAQAGGLGRWDFFYRAERAEPTVFDRFWTELYKAVWNDEFKKGMLFAAPGEDVMMDLILNKPGSPYFDDRTTPTRETLDDVVGNAFQKAVAALVAELGPVGPRWKWGRSSPVTIGHLAMIPGLGSPPLAISGNRGVINAASGSFGPSWRMVVEMGPEVRAWGSIPGGASGNPGSRFYDNGINDWAEGAVTELVFLRSFGERHPRIIGRTDIGRKQ